MFWDRDDIGVCNNLDDRYYLYIVDNNIVAMTGLEYSSEYEHMEVCYTCTHPDYRHRGYMQKLFKCMLKDVNEDVYCSCWRVHGNDRVNLSSIMKMFGFEKVVHSRGHWKIPYNCNRNYDGGCVYREGDTCECYEDLYIRRRV